MFGFLYTLPFWGDKYYYKASQKTCCLHCGLRRACAVRRAYDGAYAEPAGKRKKANTDSYVSLAFKGQRPLERLRHSSRRL